MSLAISEYVFMFSLSTTPDMIWPLQCFTAHFRPFQPLTHSPLFLSEEFPSESFSCEASLTHHLFKA